MNKPAMRRLLLAASLASSMGLGAAEIVAYPQPARTQICFMLDAPSAGRLVIEVYNPAMQHVATFTNDIAVAGPYSVCEDLGPIVTGAYVYRASLGGIRFGRRKFWVLR